MSERERNIEQITDEERNYNAESSQDIEEDVVAFHTIFHSPMVRRSLSKLIPIFTTGSPQVAKRAA